MSLPEVESLLCQKVGMDPKIIGSRKIAKAVETRLSICGINHLDSYLKILSTSSAEMDELAELLVTPETWFFRDRAPFEFLKQYINSPHSQNLSSQKIRLLSVPCSTGEEPYSLAMKFMDMGILPEQFQIDAVDISKQSLEKAKKGVYGRNSFRGDHLEFRNRYFTQVGTEYHLSEKIKNTVDFSYGNLLDPHFLSNRKSYDIILCRNVLIYFDDVAKDTTIKRLYSLLKEDGLLLVGASETRLLASCNFQLIRHELGFAGCKKTTDREKNKSYPTEESQIISSLPSSKPLIPTTPRHTQQLNLLSDSEQPVLTKAILEIEATSHHLDTQEAKSEKNHLEAIRDLADQGNLGDAVSLCQKYLQEYSTNVEAHVLLGQIYQAQGREIKAETYFQKAIYLDPKNYQALLHLALLKEQSGELEKADILRQRIRRLENS